MSRRPHSDASTRWQHFNENYKLLCLKANIGISQILIKASKKNNNKKKMLFHKKHVKNMWNDSFVLICSYVTAIPCLMVCEFVSLNIDNCISPFIQATLHGLGWSLLTIITTTQSWYLSVRCWCQVRCRDTIHLFTPHSTIMCQVSGVSVCLFHL